MAEYIKKDKVLSLIRKTMPEETSSVLLYQSVEQMHGEDVVPVVYGRWINGKCDKCGGHAPFWAMASTYYPSNFCPDCGADMRKDRHD